MLKHLHIENYALIEHLDIDLDKGFCAITGETGWSKVTVKISGYGTHLLKWVYSKDVSGTKGQDFGWIDQIQWTAK